MEGLLGKGALSIKSFVLEETSMFLKIVSQEKSLQHAHIHLTAYEMTRRMAEAVSDGFKEASSVLDGS
ncbi:MAG: hypothetical protein ACREX3_19220 [Gammaproteobacteria bacterium]